MAQKFNPSSIELQRALRNHAADVYRHSGAAEGPDREPWSRAEAEILRETSAQLSRPVVVINLEGVVYTGEYDFASAGGYTPGEWQAGDHVPVRFEGDRLFLRRPNGQELETSIVKRIG